MLSSKNGILNTGLVTALAEAWQRTEVDGSHLIIGRQIAVVALGAGPVFLLSKSERLTAPNVNKNV